MQSKKICVGVSSKVLHKEQRAVFAIQKCIIFYWEKVVIKHKYVIKHFILKRTQGSGNSY